jgi:hypothetical protein
MRMKTHHLFLSALFALAVLPGAAAAQSLASVKATPGNQLIQTRSDLIAATETYKASANQVALIQEQEIEAATKQLEELRQLVAEGLVARNELASSEEKLAALKTKIDGTRKQIADSDNLIAQIHEADDAEKALAKSQSAIERKLVKPTAMRYNGNGGWSLENLSMVQSFFSTSFGRSLPISTLGQSATHNALRWAHRNSVDIGLHPDSTEGRALIGYLQSTGIPFLAFRGAIPGVSTGPHIHIGYPSARLA